MQTKDCTPNPQARDAIDIAAAMLVLQSGFGLLSALGLTVFAIATRSLSQAGGAELLALVAPALALLLAAALAGCRRWARTGALAFEGLILFSALVRLLISHGATLALVPMLTTAVLPVTVVVLLLSSAARRAMGERSEASSMRAATRSSVGLSGAAEPHGGR